MFTGLVEDTGTIVSVLPEQGGRRLLIRTRIPLSEVRIGDSIAVDGACLTAERLAGDCFEVVAGRETLGLTTLGEVRAGRRVHLERALRLGDRLGGHLVQGHVDGTARVLRSHAQGESWILWIELPPGLSKYVVRKGSLTVDGVSLTVNEVVGDTCRMNLIPHTVSVTRLGELRPGDAVNVETDLLARYVERLMGGDHGGLMAKLARLDASDE
jgi:riboflavin synthase